MPGGKHIDVINNTGQFRGRQEKKKKETEPQIATVSRLKNKLAVLGFLSENKEKKTCFFFSFFETWF